MDRKKNMLVLVIAIAVLALVILLVGLIPEEKAVKGADEAEYAASVMLDFSASDVTAISWSGTTDGAFSKTDGVWTNDNDPDFPVSQSALEVLASTLAGFTSEKTITQPQKESVYGLDEPSLTASVKAAGKTYTIAFGSTSNLTGGTYCSTGDGNVHIASYLQELFANADEFLDLETMPTLTDIKSISFAGNRIERIENSGLSYSSSYVWFLVEDGVYKALDNDYMDELVNQIQDLPLENCVSYTGDDGSYATGTIVLSIEYGESQTVELGLGNVNDFCYANFEGSKLVYEVTTTLYLLLDGFGYDAYRPYDVIALDTDAVASFDVTAEGETYTMAKDTESGVWKYGDVELNTDELFSLFSSLESVDHAATDTDLGKSELTIVFHLSTEQHPTVTLSFHRLDGEYCVAALDGVPTVTVYRYDAIDLREAVYYIVL